MRLTFGGSLPQRPPGARLGAWLRRARRRGRPRLFRLPLTQVNPFEAYLLLAAEIQGWIVLFGVAQPASIRDALPDPLVVAWAALLALGGFTALTGLFWWGNAFNGIDIKRIGVAAVGCGTLIYAVALLTLGPAAYVAATMNLGLAAACAATVGQMTRRVRQVRDVAAAARGDDQTGP